MNGIPSWAAELEVDEFAWLSLLVKTTLVLVVARLLHAALWRANPRWRRLLWRTTALGLVLVTVSFLFPPLVSWAILPAGVSDAITKMPKHRHPAAFHSPSAARKVRDFDFSPRSVLARQARPRPNGLQSDSLAPASAGAPVPRQAVANATQPNSKAAQPPEASSSIASAPQLAGLPVWVAAIWCAGAVLIVTRTVVGMRRLAAVRNRATAVPAWLTDEAAALAGKLGCTRSPEVLQTAEIASPCIMGVRRPVILLPGAQCDRQYGHELPAILAHEIAHVLGHDVVWQLLLHAVGVLWWFHPLAWRMRSAHAAACDAVCDAIAANHVGDVAAYGRTLARLAIRVMTPNAATGMAMAQASSVRRRIESLKRRVFPFGISRGPAVCAVFFGLSLFLLLGVFALARAQADPPGDPPPKQTAQADANKNGPAPADGDKSDPDFSGLIVHVSDEAGQPVAGAELRFRGRINRVPLDRRLTTDEDGVVKFAVAAGARFDYLRMQCEKPGLVPVYYNWLG
ncbi:MAG: M56 family metallopeptidase, partial [Pirellulales bacterium]